VIFEGQVAALTGTADLFKGSGAPSKWAFGGLTVDVNDPPSFHYGMTISHAVITAAVPEPETWMLLIAGLGAVGMVLRRRSSPKRTVSASKESGMAASTRKVRNFAAGRASCLKNRGTAMSKRVALAALLCGCTNALADAGASVRILDIEAKVLNQDGSVLAVLFDGVPAESFFSVYAKDGTWREVIASPFSVSYTLSDRQVLQVLMSYEYTVFDTGLETQLPLGFGPPNSDIPCFATNVSSRFEFAMARVTLKPDRYTNCGRGPQVPAGYYLSGGWHQHLSSRDATADFTEVTTIAASQSYFVLSEVSFLPGGLSGATHSVGIDLYAQSAPVPEPETWALLLAGLAGVGAIARTRRSVL